MSVMLCLEDDDTGLIYYCIVLNYFAWKMLSVFHHRIRNFVAAECSLILVLTDLLTHLDSFL